MGSVGAAGTGQWVNAAVTPVAFARTKFNEEQGAFSPDGRWIA